MPKLTLSATPDVIDLAKHLASERGTSVSALFSQFVRSMGSPRRPVRTASKTRLATGLIKLPAGKTDRELIEQALAERFER